MILKVHSVYELYIWPQVGNLSHINTVQNELITTLQFLFKSPSIRDFLC